MCDGAAVYAACGRHIVYTPGPINRLLECIGYGRILTYAIWGRDIVCIRSINRLLEYIGYGVAGKEMQ
jgi:hypothetical protein